MLEFNSMQQIATQMIDCPKCGFNQPADLYCAQCGINVKEYKRKKAGALRATYIQVIGLALALGVTGLLYFNSPKGPVKPTPLTNQISSTAEVENKTVASPPAPKKLVKDPATPSRELASQPVIQFKKFSISFAEAPEGFLEQLGTDPETKVINSSEQKILSINQKIWANRFSNSAYVLATQKRKIKKDIIFEFFGQNTNGREEEVGLSLQATAKKDSSSDELQITLTADLQGLYNRGPLEANLNVQFKIPPQTVAILQWDIPREPMKDDTFLGPINVYSSQDFIDKKTALFIIISTQ